jgi:hypothetical protein
MQTMLGKILETKTKGDKGMTEFTMTDLTICWHCFNLKTSTGREIYCPNCGVEWYDEKWGRHKPLAKPCTHKSFHNEWYMTEKGRIATLKEYHNALKFVLAVNKYFEEANA